MQYFFFLQRTNAYIFMKTESIHDKQSLEAWRNWINVKKALILPQIDIINSIFHMWWVRPSTLV